MANSLSQLLVFNDITATQNNRISNKPLQLVNFHSKKANKMVYVENQANKANFW